eukprot:GHVL01024572.1.p1 GENE.GHVL01024572.1~~GHVL01024572.1.p1  ORF type:complete len:1102 (-),score=201.41 GHVL01024572.1:551-3856(-)
MQESSVSDAAETPLHDENFQSKTTGFQRDGLEAETENEHTIELQPIAASDGSIFSVMGAKGKSRINKNLFSEYCRSPLKKCSIHPQTFINKRSTSTPPMLNKQSQSANGTPKRKTSASSHDITKRLPRISALTSEAISGKQSLQPPLLSERTYSSMYAINKALNASKHHSDDLQSARVSAASSFSNNDKIDVHQIKVEAFQPVAPVKCEFCDGAFVTQGGSYTIRTCCEAARRASEAVNAAKRGWTLIESKKKNICDDDNLGLEHMSDDEAIVNKHKDNEVKVDKECNESGNPTILEDQNNKIVTFQHLDVGPDRQVLMLPTNLKEVPISDYEIRDWRFRSQDIREVCAQTDFNHFELSKTSETTADMEPEQRFRRTSAASSLLSVSSMENESLTNQPQDLTQHQLNSELLKEVAVCHGDDKKISSDYNSLCPRWDQDSVDLDFASRVQLEPIGDLLKQNEHLRAEIALENSRLRNELAEAQKKVMSFETAQTERRSDWEFEILPPVTSETRELKRRLQFEMELNDSLRAELVSAHKMNGAGGNQPECPNVLLNVPSDKYKSVSVSVDETTVRETILKKLLNRAISCICTTETDNEWLKNGDDLNLTRAEETIIKYQLEMSNKLNQKRNVATNTKKSSSTNQYTATDEIYTVSNSTQFEVIVGNSQTQTDNISQNEVKVQTDKSFSCSKHELQMNLEAETACLPTKERLKKMRQLYENCSSLHTDKQGRSYSDSLEHNPAESPSTWSVTTPGCDSTRSTKGEREEIVTRLDKQDKCDVFKSSIDFNRDEEHVEKEYVAASSEYTSNNKSNMWLPGSLIQFILLVDKISESLEHSASLIKQNDDKHCHSMSAALGDVAWWASRSSAFLKEYDSTFTNAPLDTFVQVDDRLKRASDRVLEGVQDVLVGICLLFPSLVIPKKKQQVFSEVQRGASESTISDAHRSHNYLLMDIEHDELSRTAFISPRTPTEKAGAQGPGSLAPPQSSKIFLYSRESPLDGSFSSPRGHRGAALFHDKNHHLQSPLRTSHINQQGISSTAKLSSEYGCQSSLQVWCSGKWCPCRDGGNFLRNLQPDPHGPDGYSTDSNIYDCCYNNAATSSTTKY